MRDAHSHAAPGARPHVALLVETSLASGRDILYGISRYVREHQPWALYHEPHGLGESAPRWLRRWSGDGIIARIQNPKMAEALARSGIPVVDVLGVVPNSRFPLVHVDDHAIARMAAEHLLGRNLRHFAFLGIAEENWSRRRYAGFAEVLAQAGHGTHVYEQPRDKAGARSWESMEDDLARWIAGLPKPCGVLVCSDQRGSRFLEACHRAGVSVPDEVAVLGVDDDAPLCEVCHPPLSSIRPGHSGVGYQAAGLLDRLMGGAPVPDAPLLVPPQQVVTRMSTDMLAVDDPLIAHAIRVIYEHAHEGLRVDALARILGLSRSVLQRRFRAVLKRSVHQEILAARIKRAKELLIKTDLPLAVVAERAGFKHQEYMGSVFRARLRQTPAQVRRVAS